MAKDISHSGGPGDDGTTVGQIKTPMCPENVGRKNDPGTHSYKGTFNTGGKGGSKGGSTISGPGVKGSWKK